MKGLGDLAGAKTTIFAPGMCRFFILSPDLVSLPLQSVLHVLALFWVFTSLFRGPQPSSSLLWQFLVFLPFLFSFIPSSLNSALPQQWPRQLLFLSLPFGDLSFLLTLLFVCFKQYLDLLSETLNLRVEWWKGLKGKKTNKGNKEDYPEEKFAGRYFKATIPITLIFSLLLLTLKVRSVFFTTFPSRVPCLKQALNECLLNEWNSLWNVSVVWDKRAQVSLRKWVMAWVLRKVYGK